MGRNSDLGASSVQADSEDISGAAHVSAPRQESSERRMGSIENGMGDLEDMYARHLKWGRIVFSGTEMGNAERSKRNCKVGRARGMSNEIERGVCGIGKENINSRGESRTRN